MSADPVTTDPVPEATHENFDNASEPIKYDESLLIIVKGKVQAPKQPDHTESRIFLSKVQAQIATLSDRIKEIKAIEEQLRGKAQGASAGTQDIRNRLKTLRDERSALVKSKGSVREELQSCRNTRDAVRTEIRSNRDKMRNARADKLEDDIAAAEYRLQHDSLSEAEEKRVQQQMQLLVSYRPLARTILQLEERLKATDAQHVTIEQRMKGFDERIKVLDSAIDKESQALDEVNAKVNAHREDLPALQTEKKENYDIIMTLRAKVDEVRKKNDDEYNDFIKRDRAYKGYSREQRRLKYLERQKERQQRETERKQEEQQDVVEAGVEPFQAEVMTCDFMIKYLRGLAGLKETEEKKEEVKAVEVPAGLKPYKKKDNDEDLAEFASGIKRSVKPQKGKAAPVVVKSTEPAKPKVTKLNFMLDTLKTFMILGVEVPQTTDHLAATIEKVEAKKQAYLDKRARAKETRANGHPHKAVEAVSEPEAEVEAEPEQAAAVEADVEVEEAVPAANGSTEAAVAQEETPAAEANDTSADVPAAEANGTSADAPAAEPAPDMSVEAASDAAAVSADPSPAAANDEGIATAVEADEAAAGETIEEAAPSAGADAAGASMPAAEAEAVQAVEEAEVADSEPQLVAEAEAEAEPQLAAEAEAEAEPQLAAEAEAEAEPVPAESPAPAEPTAEVAAEAVTEPEASEAASEAPSTAPGKGIRVSVTGEGDAVSVTIDTD